MKDKEMHWLKRAVNLFHHKAKEQRRLVGFSVQWTWGLLASSVAFCPTNAQENGAYCDSSPLFPGLASLQKWGCKTWFIVDPLLNPSSVARHLVEAHGGTVMSQLAKGVSHILLVPRGV
eukprot:580546-Pelagomonas_calceolata.AAC.4